MALAIARAMTTAFEGGGLWSQLPHELFLIILSKLPTKYIVRLRTVCKQWSQLLSCTDSFKSIYQNMPLVQTLAFLFQIGWVRRVDDDPHFEWQSWLIDPANGECYKASMDSINELGIHRRRRVVGACKGVYCCVGGEEGGNVSSEEEDWSNSFSLSLHNPGTNTWRSITYPLNITGWSFIAMAFNPSTNRCTLLLGANEYDDDLVVESENNSGEIKIAIYDSDSDAWTQFDVTIPISTGFPIGIGVYSNGRFYWLNKFGCGEIVAFNIKERIWTPIPAPQWTYLSDPDDLEMLKSAYPQIYNLDFWDGQLAFKAHVQHYAPLFPFYHWCLTGSDGRLVLVNKGLGCMWEWKEDTNEWCQVHISFPKPVNEVAVNSNGWTIATGEENMVIYNGERRVVRTIEFSELDPQAPTMLAEYFSLYIWPFEWNNVWWP